MRKSIFTALAAGAVVLAGCAKIETTEVPEGRVISFDNFVPNVVKSEIASTPDLSKFWVFGIADNSGQKNVFSNDLVELVESEWNTETAKYWQAGYTYKFGAYSNGNEQLTDGVSFDYANGHLSIEYSQTEENQNETKDLVVGYNSTSLGSGYSGTDYAGGTTADKVDFTFYHALAKIDFVFTKDATLNGVDLTIENISFPACSAGTFESEYPNDDEQWKDVSWSTSTYQSDGSRTYSLTDGTVTGSTTEGGNINPVKQTFFLIPQWIFQAGGPDLKMTFSIKYDENKLYFEDESETNEVTKTYTVSLRNSNNYWKAGYHYIYTATISAENLDLVPIEFDVTEVNGWTSHENVDDNEIIKN